MGSRQGRVSTRGGAPENCVTRNVRSSRRRMTGDGSINQYKMKCNVSGYYVGKYKRFFNSVVCFSSVTWSCLTLQPHGLQRSRPPCPSPVLGVYSNSCPSSRWCHPTVSSSVVPFSSILQSFPASGSFPVSQFFASGGQSIGISASVLPMNIQDWFPLGLTGWISLQSKEIPSSTLQVQYHSSKASILWCSAFFIVQLSHPCMTWLLEKPLPWLDGPLLAK